MSWYFLGGFSAYAIVPSGSTVNHSGCSLAHGWSGAHCSARSSAISIPWSRAAATKSSKSSIVPSAGCTASWPPSSLPIAHGEPTSLGAAVTLLLRPLRWTLPTGWIGGRYTTSKPILATRGSALVAVANVPWTGLPLLSQPPVDRGKNSYHEPNRASGRSTHTPYCSPRVSTSRSGYCSSSSTTSGASAAPARVNGSPGSRSRAAASKSGSRSLRGVPAAARSSSRAPTSRSLDSSASPCPASSLAVTPRRHVAIGSPQPSTRNVHRPTLSGTNWPWNTSGVRPGDIVMSCGFTRAAGLTTSSIGTGSGAAGRAGSSTSCGFAVPW